MGDRFHLSNEQELYDYYNIHRQSTESPTTTSSASSPMTSIVQNNSMGFHWQSNAPFDPMVSQYYRDYPSQQQHQQLHAWSLPQPQQHQHPMIPQQSHQHAQLQQQLLHQQQNQNLYLSYNRNHSIMQGAFYQDPFHYHQMNHNFSEYHPPPPSDIPSNNSTLVDVQQHHMIPEINSYNHHHDHHPNAHIPINEVSIHYSPQHIPFNKVTKHETIINTKKDSNNNSSLKMKKSNSKNDSKVIIEPTSSQGLSISTTSKKKAKYETNSPKTTPIPSPVIPSSVKRKRNENNNNNNNSRRSSVSDFNSPLAGGRQQQHQLEKREGGEVKHSNGEEDEEVGVAYSALKEGDVNQKTVDQLENELAFLRDECATILIMLDSLRNAFMADISTTADIKKQHSNKKALMPLTGTINFMEENNNNNINVCINTPTTINQSGMNIKPRRSIAIAQNPEMEREMRIAYDDLMLQVRQLEKKVEKLENKSRNACIIEDSETKKKRKEEEDEERYSQTSSLQSTPLSSEDEVLEYEEDEEDDTFSKAKKRKVRRASISTTTVITPTAGMAKKRISPRRKG